MIRLHREGKGSILLTAALFVIVSAAGIYFTIQTEYDWLGYAAAAGMLVLLVLVVNFFRNPRRMVTLNNQHILAPCDGRVIVIEKVYDKIYFKRDVRQISIFMSPLNVHVNRNPVGGVVQFAKYIPGKFFVAWNPKSSDDNEHNYVATKNDYVEVGYKQIAGGVARRIKCYVKEGDEVRQGSEFGFIKFGSRMDVLIPLDAEVKVKLGSIVRAGKHVVATVKT